MSHYAPVPDTDHYQIRQEGSYPRVTFFNDQEGKVPVLTIDRTYHGNIGTPARSVVIGPRAKLVVYTNRTTRTFINTQITDLFVNLEAIGMSNFNNVMVLVPSSSCCG
jgi:hypothetical protein